MRVLFISTSFPPHAESQSIRNAFLIRGLVAAGAHVTAVAPSVPHGDATLTALLPPGVDVLTTEEPRYDRLQRGIAALPMPFARQVLRSGLAVAAGRITAPDVRVDWARLAVRRALAIDGDRPDVVVSAAGSFSAHLAAARIVRMWKLPWVAEYGDPWTFNPLPPASHWHIRRVNDWLERRALRVCSAVTVTTEETRVAYRGWLGGEPLPVHTVPCGFDERDFPTSDERRDPGGRIVISYIGAASRRGRSLVPLLDALAALRRTAPEIGRRIELRLVGQMPAAFRARAGQLELDDVRIEGPVCYRDSVRSIADSDILVLMGNRSLLQIPLKAFMYLGSGRPVLMIGQLPPDVDPTWKLVRSFDATHRADNDAGALARAIEALARNIDGEHAAARRRREAIGLHRFRWSVIGAQFATIVREAALASTTPRSSAR